jgi:hypothetical protein
MDYRSLFLYPGEEIEELRALLRNLYLMTSIFTVLIGLLNGTGAVMLLIIPAFYWTPALQQLIDLEDVRVNAGMFLGQHVSLGSLMLAGATGAFSGDFFLPAEIFLSALAVSPVFQLALIPLITYRKKEMIIEKLKSSGERVQSREFVLYSLAGLAGLAVLLYGAGIGLTAYLNGMADPVNEEAELPGISFQSLFQKYGNNETEIPEDGVKSLEGKRLEKRLHVAGTGLADSSATGEEVFSRFRGGNLSQPEYTGSVAVMNCGTSQSSQGLHYTCDRDTEYPATFTSVYKGWLGLATNMGVLNQLQDPETRDTVSSYIERANFYDTYLVPGFEMKPIETAFYSSDSGLYIVGSGDSEIKVNGEPVNATGPQNLRYIDKRLETGYHEISRGNYTVEMPVYGYLPGFGRQANRYAFTGSANRTLFFDKAVVEGDGWSREVQLGENRTSTDIPGQPRRVVFSKGNFTVPVSTGYSDETDERPQSGEAFGMTKKEYSRFQWITSNLRFLIEPHFEEAY